MEAVSKTLGRATAGFSSPLDPVASELLGGLINPQKTISPKFFYDERGSQLFDQITALPEYYPTRAEVAILQCYAEAIAEYTGRGAVLIEPGAGSCGKVCHLLEALSPAAYLPQDISADFLHQAAQRLRSLHPWLRVHPLAGDFLDTIEIPDNVPEGRRVVFYPGSTIGNFDPSLAVEFLRSMRRLAGGDGGLIIGVDLQKEATILNAAYNDEAGVTAEFNRNILNHVNVLLNADFNPHCFRHHAFYNEEYHRIEMHLVSKCPQQVNCNGIRLNFAKGESIHTESSYKYTPEGFAELASTAGFQLRRTWMDDEGLFSVHYLD